MVDNLNTHKLSALYKAFDPYGASQLAVRFEMRHAPKHGTWPDMAEIEIGVLSKQRTSQRIPDPGMLEREVAA